MNRFLLLPLTKRESIHKESTLSNAASDMMTSLLDLLREKPYLQLDDMVGGFFWWDISERLITSGTISRTLKRAGWSRNVDQQVAKDRHPDLRDLY